MTITIDQQLLRALPKCEHHMHLEGALTPSLLFELAAKHQVSLPSDDPAFESLETLEERYRHFTNLDDFLHYYFIGMQVLVDASDYERLAWDYFQHAAIDGVAHAEIFFNPHVLTRGISYDAILSGFDVARERARSELNITSELMACFARHLPPLDCLQTFHLPEIQAGFQSGQVVGIGLGSSELPFPPKLFTDLYKEAARLNLKRTIHAGEEGPAAYVQEALDSLAVTRIDHGIHAADDPLLLQRLARENILLTVCPNSNVVLRCVPSVSDVPIRRFLDAGVPFSINSDDPAYFGGKYVLDNYCAVQDAFDLTVDEWRRICSTSIEHSWCSDSRKEELRAKLNTILPS